MAGSLAIHHCHLSLCVLRLPPATVTAPLPTHSRRLIVPLESFTRDPAGQQDLMLLIFIPPLFFPLPLPFFICNSLMRWSLLPCLFLLSWQWKIIEFHFYLYLQPWVYYRPQLKGLPVQLEEELPSHWSGYCWSQPDTHWTQPLCYLSFRLDCALPRALVYLFVCSQYRIKSTFFMVSSFC